MSKYFLQYDASYEQVYGENGKQQNNIKKEIFTSMVTSLQTVKYNSIFDK